jgi:hypothetical protein
MFLANTVNIRSFQISWRINAMKTFLVFFVGVVIFLLVFGLCKSLQIEEGKALLFAGGASLLCMAIARS